MFVKAPASLISAGNDFLKITSFGSDELKLKRMPNSVDTLAPGTRALTCRGSPHKKDRSS